MMIINKEIKFSDFKFITNSITYIISIFFNTSF